MRRMVRWLVGCAAGLGLLHTPWNAQSQEFSVKVAERTVANRLPVPGTAPRATSDLKTLDVVLKMAHDGYDRIRHDIQDYTCLMVKRERVNGRLGKYQYMYAKVRHERASDQGDGVPFSVYLRFLSPADVRDREVLYVAGRNDGKLVARKGGLRFSYITTEVLPTSDVAMSDNRYPVTEFGIENLVRRFLEVAEEGALLADCKIELLQGAKVDGRPCRCIQVTKLDNAESAPFYVARVFIDQQLEVPIHYEAYDWPDEEGGEPKLIEQYTYRDLKLNVGLTEADFVRDNPAYAFSPTNSR